MNKFFVALLAVSILWLSPFVILSFFNQPNMDDFLYSALTVEHGFWEGQRQMFIKYNGRYFSTAILSINSMLYGSSITYKILPIVTMMAWVAAIYRLARLTLGKALPSWQRLSLSFFLVAVYYTNMSGIYEGYYWMAAVGCYQLPIILFVFLFSAAAQLGASASLLKRIGLFFAALAAAGCHEMIAVMATMLAIFMMGVTWLRERKIHAGYCIINVAAALSVLIQLLGIGNLDKAGDKLSVREWGIVKCITAGIGQTCYHILTRCLLSPSFWLAALLVLFIAYKYAREGRSQVVVPDKRILFGFISISLFLIYFPAILVVYIEGSLASMRVMNLSYFAFTVSLFAAIAIAGTKINLEKYISVYKNRHGIIGVLIVLCFIFPGNLKLVLPDIISGAAYRYSKQVNERYAAIKACSVSPCPLPCLTEMHGILSPYDVCNDTFYISCHQKIFGKKLVVQNYPRVKK